MIADAVLPVEGNHCVAMPAANWRKSPHFWSISSRWSFELPRGGVPVGIEVASALHAPLDLLLVRKIGVPGHAEVAAGAVIDGGHQRGRRAHGRRVQVRDREDRRSRTREDRPP
ncbi:MULTISPECIES: hypothetical protein [unclassified Bradyrhizobium]|uniref:hypothetical protein n=1 Tax=unclassified Bradyrhizobium TaxID=2631580 RepID=UPI0024479FAC|nr:MULTISPECIES: hypothetical protein [unclassified Bradyrhizobium]MDH2344143.1 hypothetical protein [Bradyrhizobium sp. SSUT77]MDH2356109.1 hypothetical protein [Bradyrhizobium sp. SSUT112]